MQFQYSEQYTLTIGYSVVWSVSHMSVKEGCVTWN